jgi:vancomycin resistance protein YoaR
VSARPRRVAVIVLSSVVGLFLVLLGAWAIDSAVHSGQVVRNVTLGDENVGGLTEAELAMTVAELAEQTAERPVVIETPNGTLELPASEAGLSLDEATTLDDVLDTGRDRSFFTQPFVWLGSILRPHLVEPTYRADRSLAETAIAELTRANLTPPVEPTIVFEDDEIVAVPGQDGVQLDPSPLGDLLTTAAGGADPIAVPLATAPLPPTYSDSNIEAVAAEATALAEQGLTVVVGGRSTPLKTTTLKSWMRASPAPDGDQLILSIDAETVESDVLAAVGSVGETPTQLTWNVSGGGISYTEGSPGTTCCAEDSSDRIVDALRAGQNQVQLELIVREPDHDAAWAESMQITQQVSTFTTPHACCESRVTNIQRIADIVRGAVIPPGDTFSVNGYVGQRTAAKGFVEAGVIYNGVFTNDVGGGVSQFATTLFNAAFFAGLELPEYQAHTIYISRYPYGREATLSFPSPDLKIRNNTPFGILIWPTYTDTSVTVTLYSTPWISGEETGQREERAGACRRVITERTRTWLADGRREVDTVSALYQPGEGIRC